MYYDGTQIEENEWNEKEFWVYFFEHPDDNVSCRIILDEYLNIVEYPEWKQQDDEMKKFIRKNRIRIVMGIELYE